MTLRKIVSSLLVLMMVAGCGIETSAETGNPAAYSAAAVSRTITLLSPDSEEEEEAYDEKTAVKISLKGSSAETEGKGVTIDDGDITIESAGTYVFSGSLKEGSVTVDTEDEETVRIILNGADITSSKGPGVYVKNAKEVILTSITGTSSSITSSGENKDEKQGAVYAKDDLVVNGGGRLTIECEDGDAIHGGDKVKLVNAQITIKTGSDGVEAKEGLSVSDSILSISAEKDGLKAGETDDATDEITVASDIVISGGVINVTSGDDGIQTTGNVISEDVDLSVTAGGGYENGENQSGSGKEREGFGFHGYGSYDDFDDFEDYYDYYDFDNFGFFGLFDDFLDFFGGYGSSANGKKKDQDGNSAEKPGQNNNGSSQYPFNDYGYGYDDFENYFSDFSGRNFEDYINRYDDEDWGSYKDYEDITDEELEEILKEYLGEDYAEYFNNWNTAPSVKEKDSDSQKDNKEKTSDSSSAKEKDSETKDKESAKESETEKETEKDSVNKTDKKKTGKAAEEDSKEDSKDEVKEESKEDSKDSTEEDSKEETKDKESAEKTSDSAKGISAEGSITLNSGKYVINASDDAINAAKNVTIADGTYEIRSGEDAIHADDTLTIKDGKITIAASYEGIEATNVKINDGTVEINSSDDGINTADKLTDKTYGMNADDGSTLVIDGGTITVYARGDGIDCNGSITMNDGELTVYGPTNSGNGAIDYAGKFTVNGGTVIAGGASGMGQAPSDGKAGMIRIGVTDDSGKIEIKDESGKTILTYESEKSYDDLVIASDKLEKGETYTVCQNGKELGKAEISDKISLVNTNNSGNGMFGGSRPNGSFSRPDSADENETAPSNGSGTAPKEDQFGSGEWKTNRRRRTENGSESGSGYEKDPDFKSGATPDADNGSTNKL